MAARLQRDDGLAAADAVLMTQSLAFAQAISAATGKSPPVFEVPGRNHFDVILGLALRGTALGDRTLALMRDPAAAGH